MCLKPVYGSKQQLPFMFRLMVFIFGTMIAYSMLITTKVLELGYDLEVKGEGQIYLKYAIRLVKRTPISCLGAGRS